MPATKQKKICPICAAEVSSFKVSPSTCSGGHSEDERACGECWEAYLSKEVEDKALGDIRCMFHHQGKHTLDKEQVKKLARKGTMERYFPPTHIPLCIAAEALLTLVGQV